MLKNILFDFGAVLIPINEERTKESLDRLGAKLSLKDETMLFQKYECGKLSTQDFLAAIQPHFFRKVSHSDLKNSWNAMLDPLPEFLPFFLKKLTKKYQIFLLSNTNELHIKSIKETAGPFLFSQFEKPFTQIHYSHQLGLRKPNANCFEKVLQQNNLEAAETLFIDDKEENIGAAKKLGFRTWHFNPKKDVITDLDRVLSKHHS